MKNFYADMEWKQKVLNAVEYDLEVQGIMGNYLNPGNSGFARIRNDVYIDKSGLIGLINQAP